MAISGIIYLWPEKRELGDHQMPTQYEESSLEPLSMKNDPQEWTNLAYDLSFLKIIKQLQNVYPLAVGSTISIFNLQFQ